MNKIVIIIRCGIQILRNKNQREEREVFLNNGKIGNFIVIYIVELRKHLRTSANVLAFGKRVLRLSNKVPQL